MVILFSHRFQLLIGNANEFVAWNAQLLAERVDQGSLSVKFLRGLDDRRADAELQFDEVLLPGDQRPVADPPVVLRGIVVSPQRVRNVADNVHTWI